MPVNKANAEWQGNLTEGKGTMAVNSGVLKDTPFSFKTRFEGEGGTNPEELIGAAHAGCYSMAFSHELSEAGFKPESVKTQAEVTFDVTDAGPTITGIKLIMQGKVPGISEDDFQKIAAAAKDGCPVSKLYQGAPIELDATLVS